MTLPIRSRAGTLLAATPPPPRTGDRDALVAAFAAMIRRREAAARTLAAGATVAGGGNQVAALEDRRVAWLAALVRADIGVEARLAAARALAFAPAPPSDMTTSAAGPARNPADR